MKRSLDPSWGYGLFDWMQRHATWVPGYNTPILREFGLESGNHAWHAEAHAVLAAIERKR